MIKADRALAERLRRARIACGYTSATGAARAGGWPQALYAAHEQASRPFAAKRAQEYAVLFDVPLRWLTDPDVRHLDMYDMVPPEKRHRFAVLSTMPLPELRQAAKRSESLEEPYRRLRKARREAGYRSAVQAVRHFGWKPSTYFAHENGQNGLTSKFAKVYSTAFGVAPEWLAGRAGIGNGGDSDGQERRKAGTASEVRLVTDEANVRMAARRYKSTVAVAEIAFGSASEPVFKEAWGVPASFLSSLVEGRNDDVAIIPLEVNKAEGVDAPIKVMVDRSDVRVVRGERYAIVDRTGRVNVVRSPKPKAGSTIVGRVLMALSLG